MSTTVYNTIRYGILTALAAFLLLPQHGFAFFAGDATASDGYFEAGTIAIDIDDDTLAATLYENSTTTVSLEIDNEGSLAPQYYLTAAQGATCSDGFYNGVEIVIDNGSVIYDDMLNQLQATSTDDGTWELSFAASSTLTAYEDEECDITLTLTAQQDIFPHNSSVGFSDEEEIILTLTADEFMGQTIVLNEILPNPSGADTQDGAAGEWVELFNNTDQPIDLAGWYIEDENGTHRRTIGTASTTPGDATEIGAYSWLVVYMNDDILNNDGDVVSLYDDTGTLRDRYSYGTSAGLEDPGNGVTQGTTNGTSTVASSTASGTEGKSDARIPDGVGDWIDPTPTAGEPNVVDEDTLRELGYSDERIAFIMDRQQKMREQYEAARKAAQTQEVVPEKPKKTDTPAKEGVSNESSAEEEQTGESDKAATEAALDAEEGDGEEVEQPADEENANTEKTEDGQPNTDDTEKDQEEQNDDPVENGDPESETPNSDLSNEGGDAENTEEPSTPQKAEDERAEETPEETESPADASSDDASDNETAV